MPFVWSVLFIHRVAVIEVLLFTTELHYMVSEVAYHD